MTFTVEDGTGLPNANSYVSLAEADAYFAERGERNWVGNDTEKQQALVRATDYMDMVFGARFIGLKLLVTQALEWPRFGIADMDPAVLPTKLKYACCQYALRCLHDELAPDIPFGEDGLTKGVKAQTVGPIKIEYELGDSGLRSSPRFFRPYPSADALLRDLVHDSGRVVR